MICLSSFFFFNDTATTEIYTLSLHDALPICSPSSAARSTERQSSSLSVSGNNHAKNAELSQYRRGRLIQFCSVCREPLQRLAGRIVRGKRKAPPPRSDWVDHLAGNVSDRRPPLVCGMP